jgi:hypothetical protein
MSLMARSDLPSSPRSLVDSIHELPGLPPQRLPMQSHRRPLRALRPVRSVLLRAERAAGRSGFSGNARRVRALRSSWERRLRSERALGSLL